MKCGNKICKDIGKPLKGITLVFNNKTRKEILFKEIKYSCKKHFYETVESFKSNTKKFPNLKTVLPIIDKGMTVEKAVETLVSDEGLKKKSSRISIKKEKLPTKSVLFNSRRSHTSLVEAIRSHPEKPSHQKIIDMRNKNEKENYKKELLIKIKSLFSKGIITKEIKNNLLPLIFTDPESLEKFIAKYSKKKKRRTMKNLTVTRSRYSLYVKAKSSPLISGLNNIDIHNTYSGVGQVKISIKYILPNYSNFIELLNKYKIIIPNDISSMLEKKHKKYIRNNIPFNSVSISAFKNEYNKNLEELSQIKMPAKGGKQYSLLKYQREGIAKMLIKDGGMFLYPPGLGKSIASVSWAIKKGGKTLIVAYPRNMKDPWINTFKENFPDKKVIVLRKKKDWVKLSEDCDFCIISNRVVIDRKMKKKINKYKFKNIIVDESQSMKSHTTKLTKSLYSLKIPYRVLLTATPCSKDLRDLYTQFRFVWRDGPCFLNMDPRSKTYKELYSHKEFNSQFSMNLRVYDTDELSKIDNISLITPMLEKFRVFASQLDAKKEFSEMYGTEYIENPFEMIKENVVQTEEERHFYKKFAKEEKRHLFERYSRYENPERMVAGQMTRVYSVLSSCPNSYREEIPDKVHSKLQASIDIVKKQIAAGEKVLVVTRHRDALEEMITLYKKEFGLDLFVRHPSLNDNKREEVTISFQQKQGAAVMLGTIGTLASGINIPECHSVIFNSIPFTHLELEQVLHRAVRVNTPHMVKIYNLVLSHSFDVNLYRHIMNKSKITHFAASGDIVSDLETLKEFNHDDQFFKEAIEYDDY